MKTFESIIESYAFEKMQEYGLLLIHLPTGAGKSFTVFSFIHIVLIQQKTKKKIIFVTSLKKNLQIDELKSKFSENEHNIFDEKVLLLKSNLDFVLDNWELVDKEIPFSIKEYNEYKKLNGAIKYCKEMENDNLSVQRCDFVFPEVSRNYECDFYSEWTADSDAVSV